MDMIVLAYLLCYQIMLHVHKKPVLSKIAFDTRNIAFNSFFLGYL